MNDDTNQPTGLIPADDHFPTPPTPPLMASSEDQPDVLGQDFLERLLGRLKEPFQVPGLGAHAAREMEKCFELASRDVLRIGADAVARADSINRECEEYAEQLRRAGSVMARKIEDESARNFKISAVLHELANLISKPAEELIHRRTP